MKPFTDLPLTAGTLAARFQRCRFWDQKQLDLAVARNAVVAAKTVAASAGSNQYHHHHTRDILPRDPDPLDLLNRIYTFDPLISSHLPLLWRELLLVDPLPPPDTTIDLLKSLISQPGSRDVAVQAIAAVVRTHAARNSWGFSVDLLKLVPPLNWWSVMSVPLVSTLFATTSAALWSAAPLIGTAMFVFGMGHAINALRLPVYPRVVWSSWRRDANRVAQLRSRDQLQIANAIVTAFDETASLNVENYHRKPSTTANTTTTEQQLVESLRRLGIERRSDSVTELYADYWSEHNLKWSSVEWREPDQDPAEIQWDSRGHAGRATKLPNC